MLRRRTSNTKKFNRIPRTVFFGEVVSVKDGLEALDEVMTNSYDALILDIEVPNIDGIEIAKKVRQTDQKIPIIILSSHNE